MLLVFKYSKQLKILFTKLNAYHNEPLKFFIFNFMKSQTLLFYLKPDISIRYSLYLKYAIGYSSCPFGCQMYNSIPEKLKLFLCLSKDTLWHQM